MSGIAAAFRLDGGPAEPALVTKMLAAMAFRGPDGSQVRVCGPAALGHLLLRTSDEDVTHSQPLVSRNAPVVLAMDGYLANRDDLIREFSSRGLVPSDSSDSALAMCAYELWGPDCAVRLEGEYALALWDDRTKRAWCARDHHGLRPLYYHYSGQTLWVASEISAILAVLGHHPAANLGWLAEIAADTPCTRDETAWTGIMRLPGAHAMQCQQGRAPDIREYWALPLEARIRYRREADYREHYRSLLFECVTRTARSHATIACEVSGGLDSSSIFAIAQTTHLQGKLPAPGVRGYTLAGPAGTQADELSYAQAVAAHLDVPLCATALTMPDFDWFATQAAADCDLPPYPNAAMSLEMDRRMVADGCRVSLTGIGGDQWLDGTQFYYRELLEEGQWRQWLASLGADIRHIGPWHSLRTAARLGPGSFLPLAWRQSWRRWRKGGGSAAGPPAWLTQPMQRELAERRARYEASLPAEYRDSYKMRKFAYPHWAQILDQANRQRARAGIDMRSPMMSRAFIAFSVATPEFLKLRAGRSKHLHRAAMADLLPPAVLERDSKAEFSETYFRLAKAVEHECNTMAEETGAALLDRAGVALLFNTYWQAAIDDRRTGEIWGVYISWLMLQLAEAARRQGT